MSDIESSVWSETAASNNAAAPNGWPEGMAPSAVNDAARETHAAIKREWNRSHTTITSTGTSTAYVLTYTTAPAAYVNGQRFSFKVDEDCGADATANVNSLGAKTIKKMTSAGLVNLIAGDLQADHHAELEYDSGADAMVLISPVQPSDVLQQGLTTLWIPANAMIPRTTTGAAFGTTETTTNKVMRRTLDFDASTDEHAQFTVAMPKSWDEGTITAQFVWTAGSGSGDVIWGLQGLALSNDDALDAAFGTAQTVTDTLLTAGDVHFTSATSAVTIAGTPAENDLVVFQAYRDANAGGDTLAVDAQLIGVKLFYTTDAANDA